MAEHRGPKGRERGWGSCSDEQSLRKRSSRPEVSIKSDTVHTYIQMIYNAHNVKQND